MKVLSLLFIFILNVTVSFGQSISEYKKYETNTLYIKYHHGKETDLKDYKWNSFEVREDILIHYFLDKGSEVQDHGKILKKLTYIDKYLGDSIMCYEFTIESISNTTKSYTIAFNEKTKQFMWVIYKSDYDPLLKKFRSLLFYTQE